MDLASPQVSPAEAEILRQFRGYGVRAHEMVFFNRNGGKNHSQRFTQAMQSMIDRGLIIREQRHRDAYSLSATGYAAVRSLGKTPRTAEKAAKR